MTVLKDFPQETVQALLGRRSHRHADQQTEHVLLTAGFQGAAVAAGRFRPYRADRSRGRLCRTWWWKGPPAPVRKRNFPPGASITLFPPGSADVPRGTGSPGPPPGRCPWRCPAGRTGPCQPPAVRRAGKRRTPPGYRSAPTPMLWPTAPHWQSRCHRSAWSPGAHPGGSAVRHKIWRLPRPHAPADPAGPSNGCAGRGAAVGPAVPAAVIPGNRSPAKMPDGGTVPTLRVGPEQGLPPAGRRRSAAPPAAPPAPWSTTAGAPLRNRTGHPSAAPPPPENTGAWRPVPGPASTAGETGRRALWAAWGGKPNTPPPTGAGAAKWRPAFPSVPQRNNPTHRCPSGR